MTSLSDLPHWALKVIGTVLLFLLTMIFGAVPLKLSRSMTSDGRFEPRSHFRQLLISLSNCFAGGVFFSTVVLDLFPMVKEKMKDALVSVDIETEFPIGDFLIGFGFIIMLIIETFVHSCCGNLFHSHGGHDEQQADNFISNTHLFDAENDQLTVNARSPLLNRPPSSDEDDGVIFTPSRKHVSVGDTFVREIVQTDNESDSEQEIERSQKSHHSLASSRYSDALPAGIRQMRRSRSLASVTTVAHSNFRAYVLVFAISLHSLFEGLAVGLIVKVDALLQIFVALFIHKSILAFSLGVQLVDGDLPSKAVLICILIFGSMTPAGVGLGLAVLHSFNLSVRLFFSGILQGIATGTFLYVTFFEVLPHELNIEDSQKPLKILFVLIGYIAITGVCYYENRFHRIRHIHPAGEPTEAPTYGL